MGDKIQIYGRWFGIPDAKEGMNKEEHDTVPDFAVAKLYAGPLDEDSNHAPFDISDINTVTASLIASASSHMTRKFTYDGTLVSYGSKRDWRTDGKWDYCGPGGSGSADTSSCANYCDFVIRNKTDGNIVWTSVGHQWYQYSASGKIDSLEAKFNNPIKKGSHAHIGGGAIDDDNMNY